MSGTRRIRLIAQATAVCAALLLPAALATTAAATNSATKTQTLQSKDAASGGKSKSGKAGGKSKAKGKGSESDSEGAAELGDALNGLMGILGADPDATPAEHATPTPPLDDRQLTDLGKALGTVANGFMSTFQPPA
ncbi:hypothetical protein [Nocardia pseudobrasiliensis]|uniref:Secreted protein n=1 Tax=Nocardia pseudobrasiliensis TaxID=45979 RepID=A0A370IAH9_9NOCA|nr:hypothetical protein [Nocardia pseudobrasiliensis]RDI66424.1 hypothetical protein DFR76_104170 [Nocardia pseudobrasiliensis]